ncbi:high-affinity branched-chain amino acid ABC transporter permease LivM [Marinobacterium marinum]|uniref:High-affinity branched-chain amino acid ABC transporter permease LivM n=1 Tax=Marinobacterium marinum TaxID=2756129 RepID=A0A7W2AD39_9GAMM|nr:high-affinity branched-chain amino acid ABC transporter permease LivM [Marinobacterium marinum]MBA4503187.1 high-affinity branched-chain amino acid ABC transporter permease LivM [Marinobacterium marinum]
MHRAIFPALFAAGVTFLLTCLVVGIRLEQEGASLTVVGADAETWGWIAFAVIGVFLVQLLQQPLQRLRQRLPTADITGLLPNEMLLHRLKPWLIALVVSGLLVWPFMVSRGAVDLATLTLIYVMLGLGLNIVVGFAGLLDLGYVAFYAVGAYTYALLSEYYGLSFWMSLPLAGLLAAVFGCLLGFPVLRLRGDYLAIVTLGFGEIIRILLNNWTSLTGGPNGIGGIDKPSLFGLEFSRRASEGSQTFHEFFDIDYSSGHKVIFLYLVAVLLVLLTIYIINRIQRMPLGRAWEALREDEIACRSLGLNPTVIKLSAFTLGASFAGFAGCFFAARQGFISPESFTFIESAIILAIVVLGGMGSQMGVICAAIAMTILPELAREFQEYRMLMFGGVMVLMMLWRPQGLLPMKRPHLELKTS